MSGRTAEDVVVELCLRDTARQGIDVREDAIAVGRIREAARKAVVELESTQRTDVNLPFIAANASGPIHIALEVRRRDLAGAAGPDGPVLDPRVKLG